MKKTLILIIITVVISLVGCGQAKTLPTSNNMTSSTELSTTTSKPNTEISTTSTLLNTTTTNTTTTNTTTTTTETPITSITTSTSIDTTVTTMAVDYETDFDISGYSSIRVINMNPEYINILSNFNLNHPGYYAHLIISSNNFLVFYANDNNFYQYKDHVLTTYNAYSLYNENTPAFLGFNNENDTVYFLGNYREFDGTNPITNIYAYNLADDNLTVSNSELDNSKLIAKNLNGTVFEKNNVYYVYDYSFDLVNTYQNSIFLGASEYSSYNTRYFLFGEKNSGQTTITVNDGTRETEKINVNDSCEQGEWINVKSPYVYFIMGESNQSKNLYKFDPYSLTVTLAENNINSEKVEGIASLNPYLGIYELDLENSLQVTFNDHLIFTESAKDCSEVKAIGDNFYLAQIPNTSNYGVYDFSNSLLTQFNDSIVRVKTDGNFLIANPSYQEPFFLENVYLNGTDQVLTNVTNFRRISDHSAVYYTNITSSTYDVVYKDFTTNQEKILKTLPYDVIMNYSSINVYPNGFFTITDKSNGLTYLYTSEGLFGREFYFLADTPSTTDLGAFVLQDVNLSNVIISYAEYNQPNN